MLDRDRLLALLRSLALVRNVDPIAKGHLRVETVFLYPDGAYVDVFLVEEGPLLPPRLLSDLGQTMDFLLHHDVKPWSTKKRRLQLEEAIALHGVRLQGGALEREVHLDAAHLQTAVVDLAQACLRMSDLIFTKRLQLQSTFNEDVEELMIDGDLDYQAGAEVPGRFAPVPVDFLVRGRTTESAVLTLSARIAQASHQPAVDVFTKLHDLALAGAPFQRVTLLDDRVDPSRIYRDEDLHRIKEYSTLLTFSERQRTRDLLAA